MGVWTDTPVFLTGHTGFKGGWLSLCLQALGAQVHGYALDPNTMPSLFEVARVADTLASDTRADLADRAALQAALAAVRPTVVFHLAAQPLVRASYADPLGTFATNVMGTAHLLEAVRSVPSVRAVVVVTTDKVYDNREWVYPYRESDALGGHDPYSASKGAAEIVTASYRASFFHAAGAAQIATARAGNVIGGGDWAADRLVPDCLQAFAAQRPVHLRYPGAVRPWQHVLEPLSAYLRLAEALLAQSSHAASAWNFGPDARGDATVGQVAQRLAALWGQGAQVEIPEGGAHPHEAGQLRLDITRARAELGWQPRWSLDQALEHTVAWQRAWLAGEDMAAVSRTQIAAYGLL
ncbi:CDP-glucose 4,6-dehydratase [Rhodoferax ferrireducens]|uniref:CDP-glucose 4,6-dehydratase n=1 Tax=Rhodoferax ferrireducens TaxID=192843 RepID=A0ABU2CE09_9BURK|nr:CDP-glucose 4,6-dehydratase [Rhodoferax ferrireducens]MDR7379549.1 CDP-glucose 4,6-dehydratase [Rhodoferax ferrireducens]